MTVHDLQLVNYCHRSCTPLRNIMRLPREKAFALAYDMACSNRDTTAFYRFADFEHYYPERLRTDALLHSRFIQLGGKPAEEHPLSFVLQGSDFLDGWFGRGLITRIPLEGIPAESVSFTYGDSMTALKKHGDLTMLTRDMLFEVIAAYGGTLDDFLSDIAGQYRYIEAQLWDDACLNLCQTPS